MWPSAFDTISITPPSILLVCVCVFISVLVQHIQRKWTPTHQNTALLIGSSGQKLHVAPVSANQYANFRVDKENRRIQDEGESWRRAENERMCLFYQGQFHFTQVLHSNRLYRFTQSLLQCSVLNIAYTMLVQPVYCTYKTGIHTLTQHSLSYSLLSAASE